jgi:hypothetical protein
MHEGSVLGLTVSLDYPFSVSQVVEADIGIQSLVDGAPDVDTAAVPAIMREPGTFLRMVGYTS